MTIYTPRRVVCAIAGALVIATDASFNVVNQWAVAGTLHHPVVWGTLAAAGATTILSYTGFAALRERGLTEKFFGCVMLTAMCFGMAYSMVQSIQLWTTVQHTYLGKLAEIEKQRRIADSIDVVRIQEVKDIIKTDKLVETVQRECVDNIRQGDRIIENVAYDPAKHRPETWPRCADAHRRLASLRGEIQQAQAMLVATTQVELWEVDKASETLALGLPWDQEEISIYLPWILPMMLLLAGVSMFSWGMMGERPVAPEFSLALTGEAAAVDKAERFMVAFRQANGQWPSKAEISNVAGISPQRAETIRKRVMARKRK
jgi:hypothetical protein